MQYGLHWMLTSLCSQSEGHEHVANMASALGHDFVGFLAVFGCHNIRPPHFASKVSYSASPQTFAECSRSASCSSAAPPLYYLVKNRAAFFKILNTLPFGGSAATACNKATRIIPPCYLIKKPFSFFLVLNTLAEKAGE